MWVPKLFLPPKKIRIWAHKQLNLTQNWLFWPNIGNFGPFDLIGARAVSRKTPIYFIVALNEAGQ